MDKSSPFEKYGKYIDMSALNRDIGVIKAMIQNCNETCKEIMLTDSESKNCLCCIVCLTCDTSEFVRVRGFNYNFCSNCGSIFLTNRPDDVRKIYSTHDTKASYIYLNDSVFLERVKTIAQPKVQFVLDAIEYDGKTCNWSDIGCGVGEILMALQMQKNASLIGMGIEIDQAEIGFAREKGLSIIEGFLDPHNPTPDLYDVLYSSDIVSMFNVLEHIEHPSKVFDVFKKVLKKNSYLVIEVPRFPSLASYVNLVAPSLAYRHLTPPQHIFVPSEKAMLELAGNDFVLVAKWGFGQGFTDILQLALLQGNTTSISLYNELMGISNEVQKVIDEHGYADQMIYIFRKIGAQSR